MDLGFEKAYVTHLVEQIRMFIHNAQLIPFSAQAELSNTKLNRLCPR